MVCSVEIKEHIMWIGREEGTEHFSEPNEYEQIRKEKINLHDDLATVNTLVWLNWRFHI